MLYQAWLGITSKHRPATSSVITALNVVHGNMNLLHNNARPHSAAQTQDRITSFKWEQMDPPPYSPDLAPSDFHLFLRLKKCLGGKRFDDDDDLKDAVQKWLTSQAAAFYEEGIQKLVSRYDKCLNNGGEYVGK